MSPGIAPDSDDVSVDGVTFLVTAFAAATGIGRVDAVAIAVIDPPSGSLSVSSISYVLPASRSNRLPECLLLHCPLPEPNDPLVFVPAGTRNNDMPVFQPTLALAPDSR